VREFGLADIATRICLLHGTSDSSIAAGNCYINEEVSYMLDQSHADRIL
jgi:hypothetical protein